MDWMIVRMLCVAIGPQDGLHRYSQLRALRVRMGKHQECDVNRFQVHRV